MQIFILCEYTQLHLYNFYLDFFLYFGMAQSYFKKQKFPFGNSGKYPSWKWEDTKAEVYWVKKNEQQTETLLVVYFTSFLWIFYHL